MKSASLCATVSLLLALWASGNAQQSSSSLQSAQALIREGKPREALPILLETHRNQPQNPALCHQIGVAYTQLQEFSNANRFYRMALALDPRLIPARRNLGVVLWFSNQKPEAEREFVQVLKAQPDDPVPHFYIGMLNYERQQYLKAKDHFRKAGDLAMQNPEAFPAVLETSLATRDEALTNQLLSSADQDKAATSQPEIWFQAGLLFARYGSFDRAIKAFQRIRDSYSDQAALMRNLGVAQLEARRYADAIQSIEALVRRGVGSVETYLLLAEAYDGAGDLQKAYDAYARAVEAAPKSEEGYLALSNFAAAHHNNAFGLKVLSQGLERIPGSAGLLLQQGVIQALDDKMPQAEDSFRQAKQANPAWVLPSLALGITQLQTGKLGEAARSFQEAASLASDDHRPPYLLALTWVRAGGQDQPARREQIVSALRRALKLSPSHADAHVLLGQTYLSGNELDLAVAELEQAVNLEAENATAIYQLGIAYRKKGKLSEAERVMRQFEALKARQRETEDLARKELVQILKVVRQRP
ncbi:MAG TPA: tetratricopeptide repeat protein [Terriglobia bacterium]|nr:tetratricopeptide repeat protein [Terriglobia bacterium]